MSVKEFFSFSSLKPTVLEFLKQRADFDNLEARFKKPFRAYINKHQSAQQGQRNAPSIDDNLLDFFISDGFHSLKCLFSDRCKDIFELTYPSSVKIPSISNMLICIESFRIDIRAPFQQQQSSTKKDSEMYDSAEQTLNAASIKSLEVVLIVDEFRVISFDRFGMSMPSSLAFDDQVRAYLSVLRHFLMKQLLVPQQFEMAPLVSLPHRKANVTNQEKSAYFPAGLINQSKRPSNLEGVVQIREDENKGRLKANRLDKQRRKKLRKLASDTHNLSGFLSVEAHSQGSIIDLLKPGDAKVSESQARREQEELDEIDAIMEDICAEDDDQQDNVLEEKSISPSAPILLSQKANLLKDARRQEQASMKNLDLQSKNSDDIEAILGFGASQGIQSAAAQHQIVNHEEKISNSSTPQENEKLQRKASQSRRRNKIELNVEMTEEMKRQEQSVNFGATPYSSKTVSVQNSLQPTKSVNNSQQQVQQQINGIGIGPNAQQKQREFIEFKKQGQQGVQSSPKKSEYEEIEDSQRDILELIEEPKPTSSQKQKKTTIMSKKTPAKPVQGQSSLDFFIKRKGKKQVAPAQVEKEKNTGKTATSAKKKAIVNNPEDDEPPAVELPKKRGRTPSTAAKEAKSTSAQLPAKKPAPEPKKTRGGNKRGTAVATQNEEIESIENSSQQVSQPNAGRGRKSIATKSTPTKIPASKMKAPVATKVAAKKQEASPAKATRSSSRARGTK